ncbi:MAG TPA: glycosyltransferase family 2 protein [Catalimonadaceae bacterium]|nr:glycosyltransferase family 2 protein [Catalimonadaceae bacterium]
MIYSIVIPLFNEEPNIPTLYQRLVEVMTGFGKEFELVFINDGSRDRTLELIKQLAREDPRVKYINLSRNFGHQIAVSAGLDACNGNRVVIIDADLQDPPELIPEMDARMNDGFEVVYARRRKRIGESKAKLLTARFFYRILANIASINIPLDTGDFRIMDRKVVDVLKAMPEQNKFLRGQISWIGFRQTFVEYDRSERFGGKTGYTYAKMFRFALDGITSFSDAPLRLASWMGFVVSGFAFLALIYALWGKFVMHQSVPGWASLIVSVLFLGGIQLISLGVIGEYVSRISSNVKNRPLYVVDETNAGKN